MVNVTPLFAKYSKVKGKYKGGVVKFNPNKKWVEYSLDLIEARVLLQAADFISKFEIERLIQKIQGKVNYHQNHKDFSINVAGENLRTARRLLRL
jgi:hypothetical protein